MRFGPSRTRLAHLRHSLARGTCLMWPFGQTCLRLNQHGIEVPTLNLRATIHCEHKLRVHHLHLHFASLYSNARVAVLLTLACKGALEPSTDPGHAHRHTEPQGKVCLELLWRDGWLVSTNKCDKNKGEVRSRCGELHVPLNEEDLDLGPVINVTQRW